MKYQLTSTHEWGKPYVDKNYVNKLRKNGFTLAVDEKDFSYYISINTIEELEKLVSLTDEIVFNGESIEIYDSYRE